MCSIEINERQQLISTGRAKVLEYTYLWKKELKERSGRPIVTITDVKGNALMSGLDNELPVHHSIHPARWSRSVILLSIYAVY